RVESVHTVEETAASRVNAVGSSRIGVEERLAVPALGRYIRDGVAPVDQQAPEIVGRTHPSGQTARRGHDRDAIGCWRNGRRTMTGEPARKQCAFLRRQ